MEKNATHLLRLWGIAALLWGLILFGVIAALLRGEYTVPAILPVVLVFILLRRWLLKRKVTRLFLDRTPDRAVAYYRKSMSRVPNSQAFIAYMCGVAFTLYGEYDKARDELANVPWYKLPPMYEGFRTYVLSIIAVLEKKDASKGLDLALEARDLCDVSTAFPGSGSSRRSLDAHVLACELLAHADNSATATALEAAIKQLRGTALLMPAWSLAQYYTRTGQKQAADAHVATLNRLAPNCRPLAVMDIQQTTA